MRLQDELQRREDELRRKEELFRQQQRELQRHRQEDMYLQVSLFSFGEFCIDVVTAGPQYNKWPRDWQNTSAITRCHRVLLLLFNVCVFLYYICSSNP